VAAQAAVLSTLTTTAAEEASAPKVRVTFPPLRLHLLTAVVAAPAAVVT
jgi:hypothetical protein